MSTRMWPLVMFQAANLLYSDLRPSTNRKLTFSCVCLSFKRRVCLFKRRVCRRKSKWYRSANAHAILGVTVISGNRKLHNSSTVYIPANFTVCDNRTTLTPFEMRNNAPFQT